MKFYVRSWCATAHLSPRNEVTREQAESIFGVEKVAGRIEAAKKALTGAAGWRDGMQIVYEQEVETQKVETKTTKRPKFYELVSSNGGTIMGLTARSLNQAKKLFKEQGHFTGCFTVNEHGDNGRVKRGLCVQL